MSDYEARRVAPGVYVVHHRSHRFMIIESGVEHAPINRIDAVEFAAELRKMAADVERFIGYRRDE